MTSLMKRGLIIRSPWVEMILDGKKTWEMRTARTHIRGKVHLIKAGSGLIYGTAELVESHGPLSFDQLTNSIHLHGDPDFTEKYCHAWELKNPQWFKRPQKYSHPSGSVIWVKL